MNGTEQNEKIRRMKPESILEMFLEVVKKDASKSYDFPIANLLEQYIQCRTLPNFPEAAHIIESAGKVYSHKVNYLESLLLVMHDRQNAPDRTEKADNPEQADKTEKRRLPGKRLKNINQTSTTIQLLAPPKQIKKSTIVDKMNLNACDTGDTDKFRNYCQAVKSKIPVFYERVNLLISDKTDSYFDGARAISKDDPDCQKNYNVFVGCISFKEKQMMTQREFMNRIQFDNLDGDGNSIVPLPQEHAHNSTAINSDGLLEQSSIVAGDLTSNNETDLLESLRETSLLINSIATNNETGANDDCDSAMVDDDMSQLNSTADESTINNSTFPLNSTEQQNTLLQSTVALDSTINESAEISTINETIGESTINAESTINGESTINAESTINGESTINDESIINGDSVNCDAQTTIDGTINALDVINSTTLDISNINETNVTNVTVNGDSALDPLNPAVTTIADEASPHTTQNDSVECMDKTECIDNNRNIFRIKDEYLKLNDVFRLPLSVLQQEVNISLNMFGIPFGRLRRQVKFALPKDFDSMKISNKRVRDFDECSTTTTRKFVKLTDGTATPSIELTAPTQQTMSPHCDHLNDPSIVPASDANTAETPLEGSSQPVAGISLENGITSNCDIENISPIGDGSIAQNTLENPSQLVDGATASQNSAIEDVGISDCFSNDDGPSLQKITRLDSQCDASSVFDSGIGTGTEGSQMEGTISSRRMTLDLTPPSEQIEDEISTEADEQSANRIQEMTNLSEKVHSWHQRLKPILLHSENRNDFDVKETSRNIVECFSSREDSVQNQCRTDGVVSFKKVMENRDKADTARYFFSMLQMANNMNIELVINHNDSSKLCPQDKIMMKLLSPNIREINPNEKN